MLLLYLGLALLILLIFLFVLLPTYVIWSFLEQIIRIFQEKPLFSSPRGQPVADAEDLRFNTDDGLVLAGCYLKTQSQRRGVILFGLEFGSNRWASIPYCEFLRKNGFDIFAFEMRGQGDSASQPNYEPLQWVTNYEVCDFRAALSYLKIRPDADSRGVGLYGMSKGGSAGLIVAAGEPYVRCAVVDGVYATFATMVPYMKKWLTIYTKRPWVAQVILPFYFRLAARLALRKLRLARNCEFPYLEEALPQFAPRPLLMIHGGADNYIKPAMAKTLFKLAGQPKDLWMVDGAKHNQAFHMANGQYQQRVLDFFTTHLAPAEGIAAATPSADNGSVGRAPAISLAEPAPQRAG